MNMIHKSSVRVIFGPTASIIIMGLINLGQGKNEHRLSSTTLSSCCLPLLLPVVTCTLVFVPLSVLGFVVGVEGGEVHNVAELEEAGAELHSIFRVSSLYTTIHI